MESDCLRWKYWTPHPLFARDRSRIIERGSEILAHGGIWPIRLAAELGKFSCFHLIDWAARPNTPGVGVQVLHQCGAGLAANFSIGGSAMSRKIPPVVGFRAYNPMWFLVRPMRPLEPVRSGLKWNWKSPLRAARNLIWYLYPIVKLPADCKVETRQPAEIPECLWPRVLPGIAVSERSPSLLEHISSCPTVRRSACAVLSRESKPLAYMFLVQVGSQIRLADYGPAGLDEETATILGTAAQELAKRLFPTGSDMLAVTSEAAVRNGFARAGFRLNREEPIRVLKIENQLENVDQFRLTLLDWDALC